MKVVTITEVNKRAELVETPMPEIDANSVLIKTHYSGVSIGTEMWVATGKRLEGRTIPFPAAGYQLTGEIVKKGDQVSGFEVGERVVAFASPSHAQFVKANKDYVHKLANPKAAKACALFVMPSVGAHALTHADVNTGNTVLVVGQGLIGQCTAQLARLRGAYVITSELSPERLAISQKYCSDWVIDASKGPVSEQLLQRFPGGVDVVLESTGFQGLLEDAMKCVRAGGLNKGGKFVFEGWYPDTVSYTFSIPHGKQLQCFYPAFIGERPNREGALRLIMSGKLEMDPLISHLVPWQESAALYTRLFTGDRNHFNGIVFDWTA
ncbi:MAG: hypothetical protein A2498_06835 [Lentisphaerae bacterium RIFOXYC12_FULL_60_16]|nr:MAG: hypothetical protein A2498_06835 [Lentisphaerae bacterium RIFOXYC12_FULL_60_16]